MTDNRPRIKVIPPLALLLAIVVALVLEWLSPPGLIPPFPSASGLVIGVPMLAASIALNVSGARAFMSAGTPINPYKTPRLVVQGGAYRITRNPMYLGMVGIVLGLGPAFSLDWALATAPMLWAVLHWGAVLPEERYMSDAFGAEYDDLRARTRRWL